MHPCNFTTLGKTLLKSYAMPTGLLCLVAIRVSLEIHRLHLGLHFNLVYVCMYLCIYSFILETDIQLIFMQCKNMTKNTPVIPYVLNCRLNTDLFLFIYLICRIKWLVIIIRLWNFWDSKIQWNVGFYPSATNWGWHDERTCCNGVVRISIGGWNLKVATSRGRNNCSNSAGRVDCVDCILNYWIYG